MSLLLVRRVLSRMAAKAFMKHLHKSTYVWKHLSRSCLRWPCSASQTCKRVFVGGALKHTYIHIHAHIKYSCGASSQRTVKHSAFEHYTYLCAQARQKALESVFKNLKVVSLHPSALESISHCIKGSRLEIAQTSFLRIVNPGQTKITFRFFETLERALPLD